MIVYFLIAFGATIVGVIAGLGGGVIIKPLMHTFTTLPLDNINILSSITVFTMTSTTLIIRKLRNNMYEVDNLNYIIFGSIIGGVVGNKIFDISKNVVEDMGTLEKIQIILLVILLLVALFKRVFSRIPEFKRSKSNFFIIGLFLATIGSFLGIGGGPINVALLMIFFKLDIKTSVFISIIMIFFSQLSNLISYAFTNAYFTNDLTPLLTMLPAAIIGGLIGGKISKSFNLNQTIVFFNVVTTCLIILNIYNLINIH